MARQCSAASHFLYFVGGIGIGAIAALLWAPQSGEETREMISRKAEEGKDYVAARKVEVRRRAEDLATEGRRKLEDLKEQGKDLASRVGLSSQ